VGIPTPSVELIEIDERTKTLKVEDSTYPLDLVNVVMDAWLKAAVANNRSLDEITTALVVTE